QFKDVELAFYDKKKKKYITKRFEGPFEITNLSGNISFMGKNTVPHVHVVLGRKDFKAISGHLNKATVTSTLETFILTTPLKFVRKIDATSGLKLLHFE
ncbi:MAG TPA: DNA-binding protein, partial [Candidatus Aenigmarchaeota archaeon]|nr:DNA-binding protein [Candidatus Aenigmarchaeota archaeon]